MAIFLPGVLETSILTSAAEAAMAHSSNSTAARKAGTRRSRALLRREVDHHIQGILLVVGRQGGQGGDAPDRLDGAAIQQSIPRRPFKATADSDPLRRMRKATAERAEGLAEERRLGIFQFW